MLGFNDTISNLRLELYEKSLLSGQIISNLHSSKDMIGSLPLSYGWPVTLQDLFNIPLSEEALSQLCELDIIVRALPQNDEPGRWTYLWDNDNFSIKKCYNLLIGSQPVHPAIKWI
jgi:hypothetical protein